MSHNHEPERAAPRHKPAIIAIIVALAVALVAFLIFTPGADEVDDGIVDTAAEPPDGEQTGRAGREHPGEEFTAPVLSFGDLANF